MKKIVVFILLFLPTLASASTLARLDSLRLAAAMEAGVDSISDQLFLVSANRAVNISVQEVSGRFPAVEKAAYVMSVDGRSSYAISDTTFRKGGLIWCQIWNIYPAEGTDTLRFLKIVPSDSTYEYIQEGKSLAEDLAPPVYVYTCAGSLYVSPTPNYVDTIKYGYYAIGRFLSGDTATTDISPEFRHLIVLYAAYLIRKDLRMEATPPW